METTELRLGNLVRRKSRKTISKVEGIYDTGIHAINPQLSQTKAVSSLIVNFEGIEITKEILLKNNFIQGDGQTINTSFYSIKLKFIEFSINPNNGCLCMSINDNDIYIPREILFVHELQNIIFEITRKELRIIVE